MSHTPGPWTYTKCPCSHKGCLQFTISTQGGVGFEEADARLIAAAPDLLEALKYVIRGVPDTWDGVIKARAAIKKAEGTE